jgi:hypothetical protein
MTKDILECFNIPASAKATKKLKTYLLEKYPLKSNDKKILKKHTKTIILHYILNQSKINISKYEDKERKYIEIYFIVIEITSKDKIKQISNIIQSIFQKPIVLIFQYENSISLNIAPKRVSKVDASKLVTKELHFTSWIDLNNTTPIEQEFLEKLDIKNHPFTNFYDFYTSYVDLTISFNASKFSGKLEQKNNSKELLEQIQTLQSAINDTMSNIKKEDNIRAKVNLNIELKKLQEKMEEVKSEL